MIERHPVLVSARDFIIASLSAYGLSPMPSVIYSPQSLPATEPPWPFVAISHAGEGPDGDADTERMVGAFGVSSSGVRSWQRHTISVRAYCPQPTLVWEVFRAYCRTSRGITHLARSGVAVRSFGTPAVIRDEMDADGARLRGDWSIELVGPPLSYDFGAPGILSRVTVQVNK